LEQAMPDEPAAPATPPGPTADEFAAIPAPPRGKNPVVAAAVIALAALIGWHLRDDVRYAFAGRHPTDLGDARSIGARSTAGGAEGPVGGTPGVALKDNTFVTVAGQAERRYALWVEPKGERERQTIFRLFGAGTRLFVREGVNSGRDDLAERWTGRLRRFDKLPYGAALRKYYAAETQVTRYLDLDALKNVLLGAAAELRDRTGGPIAVGADEPLVVDVDVPGELKVYLTKDKFPSLADARHELEKMQLGPSPGEETKEEYVFVVPLPDARKNEIVDKLSAREIAFQPRQERYNATRAQLRFEAGAESHAEVAQSQPAALVIIGKTRVPWAHVKAVGLPSPMNVDGDAFLLIEDDAPSSYWWAPLLLALLAAFAAFNVWYLVRTLRSRA
jgi:hypothetical protein